MTESSQKILVVDDERFFREAIQDALAGAGLDCIIAKDGPEALEAVRDPAVGVVVLDIELPGIDGIEVLKHLRGSRPELGVLILSSHTEQETVLEALRQGACDYLAKPLHREELLLAVRRALETHTIHSGWARLRGRLRSVAEHLAALDETARRTVPEERQAALLKGVVEAASEVLDARRTSVMLLDEEGERLQVAAVLGHKLPLAELDSVAIGEGVAGQAFAAGEAMLVNGVSEDQRFVGRSVGNRYLSDSFVVAPICAGKSRLGVLCATDRAGGAYFDEEDTALLRLLGQQTAQLLSASWGTPGDAESAAAQEPPVPAEPDGSLGDAEVARAICEAVTSELEPHRVLTAALRPVALALEAAPVALYLLEPGGDLVRQAELDGGVGSDRQRLDPNRGLTGAVLATGCLVASDAPASDPRFDEAVDTPEAGVPGPLLFVPLQFRGKTLGLCRAFAGRGGASAARTGEVISAALSAAVRNVLLYRSLVNSIEEVARVRRQGRSGPPSS